MFSERICEECVRIFPDESEQPGTTFRLTKTDRTHADVNSFLPRPVDWHPSLNARLVYCMSTWSVSGLTQQVLVAVFCTSSSFALCEFNRDWLNCVRGWTTHITTCFRVSDSSWCECMWEWGGSHQSVKSVQVPLFLFYFMKVPPTWPTSAPPRVGRALFVPEPRTWRLCQARLQKPV